MISICLPTLNARSFLEERMQSIFAQTLTDWELIVCDSFSDDGTWEYFQQFKSDPRIHLHQVPREGLYAGWNECLRRTRGRYVYIATADDTMASRCFEVLLAAADRHPTADLIACRYSLIDAAGELLPDPEYGAQPILARHLDTEHVRTRLLSLLVAVMSGPVWTTMSALLIRRELFTKIGFFPTNWGPTGDIHWGIRAAFASPVVYIPRRLATWRMHHHQASRGIQEYRQINLRYQMWRSVLHEHAEEVISVLGRWANIMLGIEQFFTEKLRATGGLYRYRLKEDAQGFLKTLARDLRDDPWWVARQAVRGFPWQPEMDKPIGFYLQEMVAEIPEEELFTFDKQPA